VRDRQCHTVVTSVNVIILCSTHNSRIRDGRRLRRTDFGQVDSALMDQPRSLSLPPGPKPAPSSTSFTRSVPSGPLPMFELIMISNLVGPGSSHN
jgi:hypothetical protein